LTKNSTTTNTYRVIFSSRNHMKTTQEIVLFSPVFCPTIGGRFKVLADKLRKTTKKINRRKVVVTEISAGSLFSQQHSAGIFLSEKISSAMFRDISNYAITQGALLFSSFEGDVEEGAMVGLDVRSKIRPFLNLTSLERAGLKINPTLLRMCRTVEEN